jgi:hypothetical protein
MRVVDRGIFVIALRAPRASIRRRKQARYRAPLTALSFLARNEPNRNTEHKGHKHTGHAQTHTLYMLCTDSCGHAERCAVPAKLFNCPCPRRGAPDAATGACRDDGRQLLRGRPFTLFPEMLPAFRRSCEMRAIPKPEPGLARAHRMSGGGSPDFAHRTCCGCGA